MHKKEVPTDDAEKHTKKPPHYTNGDWWYVRKPLNSGHPSDNPGTSQGAPLEHTMLTLCSVHGCYKTDN